MGDGPRAKRAVVGRASAVLVGVLAVLGSGVAPALADPVPGAGAEGERETVLVAHAVVASRKPRVAEAVAGEVFVAAVGVPARNVTATFASAPSALKIDPMCTRGGSRTCKLGDVDEAGIGVPFTFRLDGRTAATTVTLTITVRGVGLGPLEETLKVPLAAKAAAPAPTASAPVSPRPTVTVTVPAPVPPAPVVEPPPSTAPVVAPPPSTAPAVLPPITTSDSPAPTLSPTPLMAPPPAGQTPFGLDPRALADPANPVARLINNELPADSGALPRPLVAVATGAALLVLFLQAFVRRAGRRRGRAES